MPDFQVLSRERKYDGWAKLDELRVRIGNSEPQERLIVDAGDASAVLLHNVEKDRLLFVKQLRVAMSKHGDPHLLEIVAGKIDPGESPSDAAMREAEEEVGHRLESLQPIAEIYPSVGILSEKVSIYYGQFSDSTSISGGGGDESEDIELVDLSVPEALRMLDAGEIRDSKTVVALLWLRNRLTLR